MKKQVMRLIAVFLTTVMLSIQCFAIPKSLIPGGATMGIKIQTQGLLVTGFEKDSPARAAGLRKGDIIIAANGEHVDSVSQLRQMMEKKAVVLTVNRRGREAEYCVNPRQMKGERRIGVYIRDSMSGIGTVTYYDPQTGDFGALGHGINDRETDILVPLESGVVIHSQVDAVKKGTCGTPGELKGKFDPEQILGSVHSNTSYGIFGELKSPVKGKPLPVAQAGEIETGEASVLSNISGEIIEEFSVRILEIHPHEKESGRNLLLQITDERLLEKTGGIVQGMGVSYNRDNQVNP